MNNKEIKALLLLEHLARRCVKMTYDLIQDEEYKYKQIELIYEATQILQKLIDEKGEQHGV